MGRMYTATFKGIAVTAAQDLLEVLCPTGRTLVIHDWAISQSTEFGDAAEEQLTLTTNAGIGTVTSGSGGGTATINPIQANEQASTVTIERNNTTIMAVGTGTLRTDLEVYAWNVRVPFQKVYTPETRPMISSGNRWTLELESTPLDSITMNLTLTFEEIG